ncbi:MAG: hypothetical protein DMG32_21785, partial [Acidobacteria bacterium]
MTEKQIDQRLVDLYDQYCRGRIARREFLKRASALTVAGVSGLAMAQALLPPFTVAAWGFHTLGFDTLQAAFDAVPHGGVVFARGTVVAQAGVLTKNNVLLKGPAIFDTQGANYGGKATIVQVGNNFTVEDIEAFGMAVPDGNGAFIRLEGSGLTMRRTNVHDGQEGILTNGRADSDILLEDAIFERLGDGSGQSHNIYVSADRSLTIIRGKYNDAYIGHCIKSRALRTTITGAQIHEGRASRAIDVPNGGVVEIAACDILQTQETDNSNIIGYGMEGKDALHAVNEFYFRASNKVTDLRNPTGAVFEFGFEPTVKVIEAYTYATALAPMPAPAPAQATSITPPTFEFNINGGAWPGWPDSTRVDMEYSNAHQHTNGRQLETAWAQDYRAPGDHTSVRWTDFASAGAPTQGYYWPENDNQLYETDNMPSLYMPWKQWIALWNLKVIDVGANPPAALLRYATAADCAAAYAVPTGLDMSLVFDVILGPGALASYVNSNYNPACLVNPDGNFTCWFGGGYYYNYLAGNPPAMHLIDDNPNYPATSSRPLRLRAWTYAGPSPNSERHAVKIGDWIYWGGGGVSDDFTRGKEFYRVYVPDLVNSQKVTQERIADAP